MPLARPPAPSLLAALLAGLLLGACSGTLFDAAGVPAVATGGGPTCDAPQHVCGGTCVAQSIGACGEACATCAATDPNAAPVCEPGAGGAYACGQVCAAGWFACASGCCRATAVAAGDDHACAVTSDAGLLCWGKNDAGQLGPAAAGLAQSVRPIAVFTSGVTAVAAGGRHTCAVQGGAVRCWGANDAGQLGDGTSATPAGVVTAGVTGATALALGASHTCAVVGAAVTCWGANGLGQLGTGDTASHAGPVASLFTAGATALSAAGDDTCAIVGSGTAAVARCWGLDTEGQSGSGSLAASRPTPVTVPLPGPALQVVVGRKHACANISVTVPRAGTPLYCWGSGGEGQMGNGLTTTPVLAPVRAVGIDNSNPGLASVFSAGEAFTCSAKAGEVSMNCNGRNDQAQCSVAASSTPVVDRLGPSFGGVVLAASAGRAFTCALVDAGGAQVVKCWGANAAGQLGRATPASAPSPTPDLVGN